MTRLVVAYPKGLEDFLECLAVGMFIDSFRDGELRRAIRLSRPRTVIDALTRSLEYEAFIKFREVTPCPSSAVTQV